MAENFLSTYLGDGADCEYPAIALAFGYCPIKISHNPTHAGDVYKLVAGDQSVSVTLNGLGIAEVSLLPFIQAQIEASGAMTEPLVTDNVVRNDNRMRCFFDLDIYNPTDTQNPDTIKIYAIWGSNQLKAQPDKYINYNDDNIGTFVTLDLTSEMDADNRPTDDDDWLSNNINLNQSLSPSPTSNVVVQYNLAQYVGDKVVAVPTSLHLLYDCRVSGVRAVRWVDSRGGVNVRKLSLGGDTWQGSHTSPYKVPHNTSNIATNDYYHGSDEWFAVQATRTLTLGDNSIPIELYDWLKELVSSPIVDVWDAEPNDGDGLWVRCNVADGSIELNPKKSVFTLTMKLVIPTNEVQRF